MDSEDPVDLIYLDFQKAFDKVAHERLLLKLESYGITGQVHDIIRNFLTGRSMAVRVGDHISSWEPVTSVVPQGSVLGPLLFILFINDMPQVTKFNTVLFADDSKVIGNAYCPEDIPTDIDCLSRWSEIWQMKFNVEKCGVLHIGENNPHHGYTLDGTQLKSVQKEKDLGVTWSARKCLFDDHIREGIGKAKRMIAWLIRNVVSRKCQRDFTRIIHGMGFLSYSERLQMLGLTTLLERRMRGDLIEAYKIINGHV